MDDTQPLSTYNIQETNFVVVMISKVKAPAKPEVSNRGEEVKSDSVGFLFRQNPLLPPLLVLAVHLLWVEPHQHQLLPLLLQLQQ